MSTLLDLDSAIIQAQNFVTEGDNVEASFVIHMAFDKAFREGDFADVNTILEFMINSITSYEVHILISVLVATSVAKKKLSSRDSFRKAVEVIIKDRPDKNALLSGI